MEDLKIILNDIQLPQEDNSIKSFERNAENESCFKEVQIIFSEDSDDTPAYGGHPAYNEDVGSEVLFERGNGSSESIDSFVTAVTTFPEQRPWHEYQAAVELQDDPDGNPADFDSPLSFRGNSMASISGEGVRDSPRKMTVLFVTEDSSSSDVAGSVPFIPKQIMTVSLEHGEENEVPTRGSITQGNFPMIPTHHAIRVKRVAVKPTKRYVVRSKHVPVKSRKTRDRRANKAVSYHDMNEKEMAEVEFTAEFMKQFCAHAKHHDHRKTGAVISQFRSQRWLKSAGVFESLIKESEANENFKLAAGAGVVLNLQNYVRYLRWITLGKQIDIEELLRRLSGCSPPGRKPKMSERN